MSVGHEAPQTWWGEVQLAEGSRGFWHVGSLQLWIDRLAHEWCCSALRSVDPLASDCRKQVPTQDVPPEHAELHIERFGISGDDGRLTMIPVLADRPVVSSPTTPFTIVPHDALTVYVSTPLWMRLSLPAQNTILQDIPIYRPSDTWFGPNTREGEMCYASKTSCRVRLADVPIRPHRAVTAVEIRNDSAEPLLLETLNLPTQYLQLFVANDGSLWTESVQLRKVDDGDLSPLRVTGKVPEHIEGAQALGAPRKQLATNALVRAFSSMFQ